MELTIAKLSPAVAIIVFVGFVAYKNLKGQRIILTENVIAINAGGMHPLAVEYALYQFCPSFVGSIESMGLQITITGLVLIFVYIKTILEKLLTDTTYQKRSS